LKTDIFEPHFVVARDLRPLFPLYIRKYFFPILRESFSAGKKKKEELKNDDAVQRRRKEKTTQRCCPGGKVPDVVQLTKPIRETSSKEFYNQPVNRKITSMPGPSIFGGIVLMARRFYRFPSPGKYH